MTSRDLKLSLLPLQNCHYVNVFTPSFNVFINFTGMSRIYS